MKSALGVALTVLASAAAVMLAATPAAAHTSLIDVQPADGGTVRDGSVVSLTFSEALLELGTEITVTDSRGNSIALEVQRPEPATVAATLPALAAGPVTVSWRVVAGDGHPIEGALSYVAEAAVPSATDSASPAPTASEGRTRAPAAASEPPTAATAIPPAATPPASAPANEANAESNPAMNWALWIAIGAAILLATVVGVVTKKRG